MNHCRFASSLRGLELHHCIVNNVMHCIVGLLTESCLHAMRTNFVFQCEHYIEHEFHTQYSDMKAKIVHYIATDIDN